MKKTLRLLSLFLGILILLGSANSAAAFVIAEVQTIRMLQDPGFSMEADVQVMGTSAEFTSSYHATTDENESYMELIWSHTAGTSLNFTGEDPDGIMPDYYDFIYTYQEFDWPFDQRPDDAYVYLTYSVVRTGDFAEGAQPNNNLMFSVYVWMIDSSGDWSLIYDAQEAAWSEEFDEKRFDCDSDTLSRIFDGMIQENGTQQDPADTITYAIGLAPTNYFEPSAWQNYTGQVKLRVQSTDFYVTINIPGDSLEISILAIVTLGIIGVIAGILIQRNRRY